MLFDEREQTASTARISVGTPDRASITVAEELLKGWGVPPPDAIDGGSSNWAGIVPNALLGALALDIENLRAQMVCPGVASLARTATVSRPVSGIL